MADKQRPSSKPEPPIEIEMRRAPWWRGGGFREVRRRLPRPYDDLPLWARVGFLVPLTPVWLLSLLAVACALIGAAALATMVIWRLL